MIRDYGIIALKNLQHRQLRSWLTVLGIVIGISAIVALISVGQGLKESVEEQFEKIGANRIYIFPKGSGFDPIGRKGLTVDDVETLEKMPEFSFVTPYIIKTVEVEFGREKDRVIAHGFPAEDAEKRLEGIDLKLGAGRFFKEKEGFVTMIGNSVSHDMFDKEVRLNNNLLVKNTKVKVIGIFERMGEEEHDNSIYIPIETARDIFNEPKSVTMIELILKKGLDIDRVSDNVKRVLEKKRDNDDFEVQTPEQLLAQFSTILLIIQIVLTAIASISLIVGAIGISNSMFTSILERTKEIGIMKAVGAQNKNVLLFFIFEACIMGLIGGILGVVLGSVIGEIVERIAANAGYGILTVSVDLGTVILGIAFAVGMATLAGALPAYRASKLKPVEALRQ